MNCKMFFLKRAKLYKLFILLSRLTQLTQSRLAQSTQLQLTGGTNFKKSMCEIELRNVVNFISCSMCCPSGGDFIKQILRG